VACKPFPNYVDATPLGFSLLSPSAAETAPDFTYRTWVLPATSPGQKHQGDVEGVGGTKLDSWLNVVPQHVIVDREETVLANGDSPWPYMGTREFGLVLIEGALGVQRWGPS